MSLLCIEIESRGGREAFHENKAILIPKKEENRRGHAHRATLRRTFSAIRRGFPARQSRFADPVARSDGADGVRERRAAFPHEPLDPVGRSGVALRDDLADFFGLRASASARRAYR